MTVPEYPVSLRVNGQEVSKTIEARQLLAHFLRDELGLTGTHIGCDTSQCGACTVLVDGIAVKSCTMLTVQANGHDVTSVEGIGQMGSLHPIQEGFWEEHGLQCGFCTPGVMMTAIGLLTQNPDPSEEEIREGLEGVICRCTGYQNIVRAVANAAQKMQRLDHAAIQAAAAHHVEGR